MNGLKITYGCQKTSLSLGDLLGYYLKSCGMGNILIEVWKLYEIGEKHLTEVLQSQIPLHLNLQYTV